MLKPLLFAAPAMLTSLAVLGSPAAVRGQSALFELQSRPVTSLEIADGAPAGVVLDLFVTTDLDIHLVSLYEATPGLFYQHDLGSDVSPPHPRLTEMVPSVGADSWFTTAGSTMVAGDGFARQGGVETSWFDMSDDGAATDHQFGRLTVPTGSAGMLTGEIWLRGGAGSGHLGSRHPFELAINDAGVLDWETFDPIIRQTNHPNAFSPNPEPPLASPVEPPEIEPIAPVVDPPSTTVPVEAVNPREIPAIEPIFIDLVDPMQPILTIDRTDLERRIDLGDLSQSVLESRWQVLGEFQTIPRGEERVEPQDLDQLTSILNPTIDLAYADLYPYSVAFDAGTLSYAPIHVSTALESNTAIPEPNSAILLLLGAMGQLLRRKAA